LELGRIEDVALEISIEVIICRIILKIKLSKYFRKDLKS